MTLNLKEPVICFDIFALCNIKFVLIQSSNEFEGIIYQWLKEKGVFT